MNEGVKGKEAKWKDKFINDLLLGFVFLGGLGLAASLLRAIESSLQTSHFVQIFLYSYIFFLMLYRKKVSLDIKVISLIILFAAVAYSGIYNWGVYAGGFILTVAAMALISLFYGYKKALWFIGLTVGVIAFCAYKFITGQLLLPVDANEYLRMPSSWGVLTFGGVLIMALIMIILSKMGEQLDKMYSSLESQKDKVLDQESELMQANIRLKLAMDIARQGWFDYNIETGKIIVSDGYAKLLGYEPKEFRTNIEAWQDSMHPDDRDGVIKRLQESVKTGTVREIEYRRKTKDGNWVWLNAIGNVVGSDNDDEDIRILGIHTDVTERKLSEEATQKALASAEKANRAKTDFLSSMSHELRTPLNAILGFSQLLESDPETPLIGHQKESVQHITDAGEHLLALINQMLELTAIESGKLELFVESVHLRDVIGKSVSLVKPLANNMDIEIYIMADIDVSVQADEVKLKQILLNLLNNAIKYNRTGGTVKIDWQVTDNGMVRTSITDTGIGISENNKSKVFKAFSRLGQEKNNIEGTGMGLVVTKNIVELMGGHIGFNSVEGEGTTFWFDLPMTKET